MINIIRDILDEKINPQIALHNGSVEVTKYEDGIVWLKFNGACAGCISSEETLNEIRREIKEIIPEVIDVKKDSTLSEDVFCFVEKILKGEVR